jgi:hypothetical protein
MRPMRLSDICRKGFAYYRKPFVSSVKSFEETITLTETIGPSRVAEALAEKKARLVSSSHQGVCVRHHRVKAQRAIA